MCLLIIIAVPVFFVMWFACSWLLALIGVPGEIGTAIGAAIAAAIMYGLIRWMWRLAGARSDAMLDDAAERKNANKRDGAP
jgi:hypothetical protein